MHDATTPQARRGGTRRVIDLTIQYCDEFVVQFLWALIALGKSFHHNPRSTQESGTGQKKSVSSLFLSSWVTM